MRPKPQENNPEMNPPPPPGQPAAIGVSIACVGSPPAPQVPQMPAACYRMCVVTAMGGVCAWEEGCRIKLCQLDPVTWAMVSSVNGENRRFGTCAGGPELSHPLRRPNP